MDKSDMDVIKQMQGEIINKDIENGEIKAKLNALEKHHLSIVSSGRNSRNQSPFNRTINNSQYNQ